MELISRYNHASKIAFICLVFFIQSYDTLSQLQMQIPPQASVYSGATRGYWFEAPADFTIVGLRVPTDASSASQNIAVVRFNGGAPPLYSSTTNNFTILALYQAVQGNSIISVNLPISDGDYIGVLGSRGGNSTNSYGANNYSTNIGGYPVTLGRLGMQYDLQSTSPINLWRENSAYIGRVELYYSTAGIIAQDSIIACNVDSTQLSPDSSWSSYAWSTGDTTQTTYVSNSGLYYLTVTDMSSNLWTDSVYVNISNPVAQASIIPTDCESTANGVITASGFGGHEPYQYVWSTGSTSASINTLETGLYSLTITDILGCQNDNLFILSALDTIPPSISTQNISVYLDANGEASITASQINNGSADNCGIASYSLSLDTFDCGHVGSNTITLTITDVHGNQSSDTATVTVLDTIAPQVFTQNAIVYLDSSGQFTLSPATIDSGSWDSCGIDSSWISQTSFDCSAVGDTIAVSLFVEDVSGNSSLDSSFVITLDTIAPTILVQNITVALDSTGNASIDTSMINNGSWDACGIDAMYLSSYSFSCAFIGIDSVYFYAIDNNGNKDSSLVYIDIVDTLAPVILVDSIELYLNQQGFVTTNVDSVDAGTWDSCGVVSRSLGLDSFTCAHVGLNMVWFLATDVNGNTDSMQFVATVYDTIAPTVFVQSDTFYLDSNGSYTITPGEIDSGSWDSCGIASYALDTSQLSCSNIGSTLLVTLTVTDVNGNSSSDSTVVVILDTVGPVAIAQDLTVYLDSTGNFTIAAIDVDNGSYDSCGVDSMWLDDTTFNCSNIGTNDTVTLFVRDVNNNLDSAVSIITTLDTIAPEAIAKSSQTLYLDSTGNVSLAGTLLDSASWDSCGVDTMYASISSFNCGDTGLNVVVLFVEDQYSNVGTDTINVFVFDTLAPEILISNKNVYLDSFGQFTVTASYIDDGTWDSCGISSTSIDYSLFTCAEAADSFMVHFTATDFSGNTSLDSAMVFIHDTIAPEVITQNIFVALDSMGFASIDVNDLDNGSWDSCGIDSSYLSLDSFDCGDVGLNTITLTVIDVHGNQSNETAVVTVLDSIAPQVFTQNAVVYLNSSGLFTLSPSTIDSGSWDSCGIVSYNLDTSSFSCADTGTFVVTMTVTDANGNSSSGTALITLSDTLAPSIFTNAVTVYLDTAGQASITVPMLDSATADNCAIDTMFLSEYDFDCSDTTSQTVTFTAIDVSGNIDSASAVVNILDTISPTMLTQNLVLYLDTNGEISITPTQIDNGTDDNCAVDSLWLSDTLFDCDDTATLHVITLFAKDVSGNVNSATATVQVFDTISPTVNAQNLTIYLDSFGQASIFPSQVDSGSLDNCGIDSSWISQNNFDCSYVGDTVAVSLFVQDVSGNSATDSSYVITLDSIAPTIIVQGVTIALDSMGNASIDTSMINNGSWDACGIDTMYLSQYSYDCGDVGTNTVTLFVQDIHGNLESESATVTVLDSIAPAILIQNLVVILDSFGQAEITADSMDIDSWDSCGIASLSISDTSFDCADHGDTITIVFTATDANGNTSMDSAFVLVLDTLPPTIFATNDTVYLDTSGLFILDYNVVDTGTMDACSIDSMYLSDSTFDCSSVDSTVDIWYIAVDTFGNTDSLQIGITVLDTINPTIQCLDSIVVNNDSGVCGATIFFEWPEVDDNCSIDSLVQIDTTGLDSGMVFPVGITQLTYAVFDQSGNSDTCSFIIEVIDIETPTLICAADTSICDSIFTFALPNYLDNCAGLDVIQIAGIGTGLFYPVGTTVNTFAVSDLYGNTDTCSFEVLRYDYPSQAEAGLNIELCEATSTDLSAGIPAIGSGSWSILSGAGSLTDSSSNTSEITGLEIGTVTLLWTIENGVCPVENDTLEVLNLSNETEINAGLDQVICDTNSAVLNAVDPALGFGTWSHANPGVILSDSSAFGSIATNLAIGDYEFYWTVENGVCPVGTDTVAITISPYPSVFASEDTYIFPPSSVEISGASDLSSTYLWFTSSGDKVDSTSSITVSPITSTTYIVRGITPAGCYTQDSVTVGLNEALDLPTAFTPDNDGYNDAWNVKELSNYPDCNVAIYNRWGNKMFESDGYEIPWDGTFKGEQLPSGAYFFVINLNIGEIAPITGSITIIR